VPSVPPGRSATSWSALGRLRRRQEWQFLAALWKADPPLAAAWWVVLGCRGVLPAVFAVASGALVGAAGGLVELLARGGTYAELYGIQAAAYRDPAAGPRSAAGPTG
jgi:hypothetical protein